MAHRHTELNLTQPVPPVIVVDMKARTRTQCGRCRQAIEVGAQITYVYNAPWHTQCALDYQSIRRAIAASLR